MNDVSCNIPSQRIVVVEMGKKRKSCRTACCAPEPPLSQSLIDRAGDVGVRIAFAFGRLGPRAVVSPGLGVG